jgi:mannosyltransferase
MLRSSDSEYSSYSEKDAASVFEEVIIIIFFIAIATLLRFWNLGTWSFWADEIFTVQDSIKLPDTMPINPIIYMIIQSVFSKFGVSEWSARLGPCIIGIISIPFMYWIARRMFGAVTGIIASLLLVIHPWHIYWSQNARAYSLAFLLAGLSAFLFYEALEKNKVRYIIGALLLTVLSIFSYLHCVLLLPVFFVYVILLPFLPVNIPKGLNQRNLLIFFVPFILALSSLFLPSVREYVYSGWGSNEWGRNALYILFTIVYSLGIPFSVASLVGGIHSLAYLNRGGLFLICYTLVPLVIILAMSPFLNVAGYYLFFTMPAYLILAALSASELLSYASKSSRVLSSAILLILVVSLVAQTYLYFTVENGGREKWKDAFQSISGEVERNDYIVTPITRIGEYYLQKSNLLQLESVIGNLETFKNSWTKEKRDVWFVIDEPSLKVLDPQQKFSEWLYANSHLVKDFPVYARVMDRTIKVWHLKSVISDQ